MAPRKDNEEPDGDDLKSGSVSPPEEEGAAASAVVVAAVDSEDDAEAAEWSRLRCTSVRTEEIADREKRRNQKRNRCADYPGLAFGSAAFGSETMMKFAIIKNELHNIMRSQLKRVDGEVTALSHRIKALDENLEKSEHYIKTATATLAEAVEMEVERRKASNCDEDEDEDEALSQFEAQMKLLQGKLEQAKCLAAEAGGGGLGGQQDNNVPDTDM